jgi:hypothetical protein
MTRLDGYHSSEMSHPLPLAFQQDSNGARSANFPRIQVTIDGESLDMLLDTGATATLTEQSSAVLGLSPGSRIAASYITGSIFKRWTSRHPDWRVVANGDALGKGSFPMIEVPRISVAGQEVGPVWFTAREDDDFHAVMAQILDKSAEGALGGSALRYFRVTIDYPGAVAYFETPSRSAADGPTPR